MSDVVLVGGSINTDLVVRVRKAPEAGETVTGISFAIFAGGKGANQAVAAARSGSRVAMLGGLGNDEFGRNRLEDLKAEGIDTGHVNVFEDISSGVALITVEENGQNRIAYVPAATWRVEANHASEAVASVDPSVILSTLELPAETIRALYISGREAGAKIICNASPEPDIGRENALSADILIVNETEALELLGKSARGGEWTDVALALWSLGPGVVVITLGGEGAVVTDGHRNQSFPAPRMHVEDTTGAGDAFAGAFATKFAETGDPFQAAGFGVLAGTIAVTRAGAAPSIPDRKEIETGFD